MPLLVTIDEVEDETLEGNFNSEFIEFNRALIVDALAISPSMTQAINIIRRQFKVAYNDGFAVMVMEKRRRNNKIPVKFRHSALKYDVKGLSFIVW